MLSVNPMPSAAPQPFRISLGQWSLHRRILGPQPGKLERLKRRAAERIGIKAPPLLRGDLDPLDVPAFVRREFDIDAIEWIGAFYAAHLKNVGYLRELKRRADGEGVAGTILLCDSEGPIAAEETERRRQTAERHRVWLDAATLLGCTAVRVTTPCVGAFDEQARLAADGLHKLAELGDERRIDVIVENHGGLSSNPSWLVTVMRQADHPRLGLLPDFGNFRASPTETYDVYEGMVKLMPYARGVSAKCFDFDKTGAETTFDFARLMRIVVEGGYTGYVGIEYEGDRFSEVDGVNAAKTLLDRVRRGLVEDEWAAKANASLDPLKTHVVANTLPFRRPPPASRR